MTLSSALSQKLIHLAENAWIFEDEYQQNVRAPYELIASDIWRCHEIEKEYWNFEKN